MTYFVVVQSGQIFYKVNGTDLFWKSSRPFLTKFFSTICAHPDRLKTELYLNSQMKFEVEYCKKELETLRMEVQVVQSKINNTPRRDITYASIDDETEQSPDVQQIFTFQDEDDEVYTFNIDKKLNLPIWKSSKKC